MPRPIEAVEADIARLMAEYVSIADADLAPSGNFVTTQNILVVFHCDGFADRATAARSLAGELARTGLLQERTRYDSWEFVTTPDRIANGEDVGVDGLGLSTWAIKDIADGLMYDESEVPA